MQDWERLKDALTGIQNKLAEIESRLEDTRHEIEAQLEAAPSLAPGVDLPLLNSAIQKLSGCQEQEQILDAFLEKAQSIVSRGVLFLKREESYVPWKAFGLVLEQVEIVKIDDHGSPVARAARQSKILVLEEESESPLPWPAPEQQSSRISVCLPLSFESFVPVVFGGDSPPPVSLDSLEILSHLAVLVLKNHSLQRLLQSDDRTTPGTEHPDSAEPQVQAPPPDSAPGLAASPQEPDTGLAESLTSEAGERVPSEAEEAQQAEARRLSRLLVSEIKLQQGEEISLGREKKDLYSRLKEEIDSRRRRYQEGIHSDVRRDYYHEEIVRILAADDDTLLGAEYPGKRE
ncbi:MAG: hypothetical protein V3T61_04865 [Acidobacteriota bacterium]